MKKKCTCGFQIKHDHGYLYLCGNSKCNKGYVLDMDGEITEYGTVQIK